MKHAELFYDHASIERGEELVELFIDSFKTYRMSLGMPESKIYEGEELGYIAEYFIERTAQSAPSEEDYANLGRTIAESWQALQQKRELQKAAYQPVLAFLSVHYNAPVAVSDRMPAQIPRAIHRNSLIGRSDKRSGFIVPSIPSVARLGVASRIDSSGSAFEVQVFDYGKKTALIAIGE